MTDHEHRPRGRGRPGGKSPPPHFPDGCVIHIFNAYPEADAFFRRVTDGGPPERRGYCRGGTGWVTLDCDPDWLLGIEPSRFFDHTTRPWPQALRDMIDWRASRAAAPILKFAV